MIRGNDSRSRRNPSRRSILQQTDFQVWPGFCPSKSVTPLPYFLGTREGRNRSGIDCLRASQPHPCPILSEHWWLNRVRSGCVVWVRSSPLCCCLIGRVIKLAVRRITVEKDHANEIDATTAFNHASTRREFTVRKTANFRIHAPPLWGHVHTERRHSTGRIALVR